MAKKKSSGAKGDRLDPKQNKSLAVRNIIKRAPAAKAAEIVDLVKKEYGHQISPNMVYMVKAKSNMATDGRPKKAEGVKHDSPLTTPALWVEAIKNARTLLKITGSVANASALLKAIEA